MENIKAAAWAFLVEHRLNKFPIDTLRLNQIDVGFHICTYHEGEAIISSLDLVEYAKNHLAFTVSHNDMITICYDEKLPFSDRDFVIAHEIGHVVLRHTTDGYILGKSSDPVKENEQEKEADAFALSFLAPAPVFAEMKISIPSEISRITRLPVKKAEEAAIEVIKEDLAKKTWLEIELIDTFRESIMKYAPPSSPLMQEERKKTAKTPFWKNAIAVLLCSVLLSSVMFGTFLITQQKKQAATPNTYDSSAVLSNELSPSAASAPSTDLTEVIENDASLTIVYVTPSGDKYHLPDCQYVRGKDQLKEFTIAEAQEEGYQPCKVCKPDK